MSAVKHVADLVVRQALSSADPTATESAAAAATTAVEACSADNDYDGRMGVRISAVFVILLGSTLGEPHVDFTVQCPGLKDSSRRMLSSVC